MTTGNGKQPLILDIVNNFDGLSSVGTIRAEMAAAVQKLRSAGKENLVRVDKFPIEEQVEDSIRWYAEACAYFSSHGNLAVPRRYVTESRMQLGVWIQTQRAVFNGKARGNLTDEQVNALNAIGMEWGSVLDRAWSETWKLAKEYYEANGNLLVPDSFQIGGIDLGRRMADFLRNALQN